MKRILAVLLSVVMLLSLCACGGAPSTKADEKSLYEHGLDVIAVMSEMTQLESYVETYTGSGEIKEIVQTIQTILDQRSNEHIYIHFLFLLQRSLTPPSLRIRSTWQLPSPSTRSMLILKSSSIYSGTKA